MHIDQAVRQEKVRDFRQLALIKAINLPSIGLERMDETDAKSPASFSATVLLPTLEPLELPAKPGELPRGRLGDHHLSLSSPSARAGPRCREGTSLTG